MDFETLKSFFNFSKAQRKAVLLFLSIIFLLQMVLFFVNFSPESITNDDEEQKWLALQSKIDSLKSVKQNYIPKIHPFNPNFISDYKGYKLGMSVSEIDRLFALRRQNKFVNSAKEFQEVTKISDSLLHAISPYFKFPNWVNNPKRFVNNKNYSKLNFEKKEKFILKDINSATQEELIEINGIGAVISTQILKFREELGCFISMEQMQDVWGLSPDIVEKLKANFEILNVPNPKKIDINSASIKELSLFPYFRYPISKNIVMYRSMNGDIKNYDDLTKIKGLSIEKAKIISLYLNF